MFFLIVISIAMMATVVYMALSKKSSFKVRIAALGALALMVITVSICLFLFFKATASPEQNLLPDALPSDIPPVQKKSPLSTIAFIVFLIALFVTILIMSLRGQKQSEEKPEPPISNW